MLHNDAFPKGGGPVKIVTLRKLPPDVVKVIQRRARERGTSITRAVVSLLEDAAGIRRTKRGPLLHDDLDSLAGSWTKEEATAFERALSEQRRIDPELWK